MKCVIPNNTWWKLYLFFLNKFPVRWLMKLFYKNVLIISDIDSLVLMMKCLNFLYEFKVSIWTLVFHTSNRFTVRMNWYLISYLLITYYVPSTVLSTGDTATNSTEIGPNAPDILSLEGNTGNEQLCYGKV